MSSHNTNPAPEDPSTQKQRWFPLESNPTLMNDYVEKLGFNTSLYHFVDVFATDDWALAMIPQPVAAVIFLYPLTETQRNQDGGTPTVGNDENQIWFIQQRIGNACGTIGLLHALLNAPEPVRQLVRPGSWLDGFRSTCPAALDPVAKARRLEGDAAIAALHDAATASEQNATRRPDRDERVITHFVAFVRGADDQLYELDGRKPGPVPHGRTGPATLLPDACKVIRQFMDHDPAEVRFTILALAPNAVDDD